MAAPDITADTITVHAAQTRLVDELYLVDADIELNLSPVALEALENGITLTIMINFEIVRIRRLMWNETVAKLKARRRLSFHPLTNQYLVEDVNAGTTRTFRNLRDATKALGQVRHFPLIDSYLLQQDERYAFQVRAYLDLESLPTPLRLLAYIDPAWYLSSEWYEHPLQH
ncbi:MAG: DUF4390 domain-containing protein [Gammaproteobacteria bacterium]